MIDDYLRRAEQSLSTSSGQAVTVGAPRIIIVPHAGYVYSGQIAAYAFKAIQGLDIKRVILIGRSHQQYFAGVVADGNDVWQTPLGDIAIDQDFIAELQKLSSALEIDSQPHQAEHSLEVEIPFLQKTLGNDMAIVPLLFGVDSGEAIEGLANVLARTVDEKTLLVISSDLAHYPDYQIANREDAKTIEAILTKNSLDFIQEISARESEDLPGIVTLACAKPAITFALFVAEKLGLKPLLLKYANSGDVVAETKNRVVGYAAVAFYKESQGRGLTILIKEEQKIALQIVRETLEGAFSGKEYELPAGLSEILQEKRGVFVTLKKQKELRGCIGNFSTNFNLAENIKEMAISAAFNDLRFHPLQEDELKDIKIEISVLSPMQKIADHNVIEFGKHGVYVKKGTQSGVYLPQVAIETGWSKGEFLDSLCEQKAGLNRDCWKDGSAELYIFTAQVFGEE